MPLETAESDLEKSKKEKRQREGKLIMVNIKFRVRLMIFFV